MPHRSMSAPATNPDGSIAHTGRRTRLTYEAIEEIADRIRQGQPRLDVIATVCRVERGTVDQWLRMGRGEHTVYTNPPARYRDLVRAVDEAESAWVAEEVGRWTDPAEKPHWKLRQLAVAAKRPEYRDKPTENDRPDAAYALVRMLAAHYLEAPLDARVLEAPEEERDAE